MAELEMLIRIKQRCEDTKEMNTRKSLQHIKAWEKGEKDLSLNEKRNQEKEGHRTNLKKEMNIDRMKKKEVIWHKYVNRELRDSHIHNWLAYTKYGLSFWLTL